MIRANFNAYDSYVTDSLYQWDLNQVLTVTGLNLATAPEIHFSNANMERAIVRQSAMVNHVVSVGIPNSLLQDPLTIEADIGIYEGETFKVIEKVLIPVKPKKRPTDYRIEDSDEEIYSFQALENAIANMVKSADFATEKAALTARIDNIISHNNDTEGNTELVDMRLDINGNVHNSAGSAVRDQLSDLITRMKSMTYHTGDGQLSGNYEPVLSFENKYFNSSTGKLIDSDMRVITNFIYCPPGAVVDIACNTGYGVSNTGNYDEYGNYLGSGPTFEGMTFRRYVIGKSDTTATITPEEAADNVTVTVTFRRVITEDRLNTILRNYAKTTNGKNVLNTETSELGFIFNNRGKIVAPNDAYYTSDYIPIAEGETVCISPRIRKFLAFDENFNPIIDSFVDATIKNYCYTGTKKGYFKATYYAEDNDVQIEYGSSATDYEPYGTIIDDTVDIPKDRFFGNLNNKTGLSFGDSIMYGSGNSGVGILDILNEKYHIKVNDYSVGGATVEKIDGRSFIGDQITKAVNAGISPDFIIFDGLSNDIAHGAIGEMSSDFNYSANGYATFATGLEYCIGLLKTNYPTVPIVYVIPHSSAGRDYAKELAYGNLAREICKKWSIPIADIYNEGNFTSRVEAQLQAYSYYPVESSGTHPNRAGYDRAYIPIIADILNKILI